MSKHSNKDDWEKIFMKAIMDIIPDNIYFKDLESRFIRCNKSQAQHLGLENPEEASGKTDFDFFSEEHAQQAYNDEQIITKQGITIFKEEKETWPDHDDTWVSTRKAPLFDLEGNIIGTLGISRDITEKKKIEEALVASEERFRTIVNSTDEGIGIVDTNEVFTFTNPAAERIFGSKKNGLIGHSLFEFIAPHSAKEIALQTQKRKKGSSSIYELEIVHSSGEIKQILVTSSPKFNKNGNYEGAFGVFRDITKRKEQEEIIKSKNKALKEINSHKDKLMSIIAHDLRSPFNAFLGLTEVLENNATTLPAEDIQVLAADIRNSATKVYNLLSNLLDWSRVQRDMIKPTMQDFLLIDVVAQCTGALNEMAIYKEIKLSSDIPADLEITADPYMLQIIIQNLLTNAIKFTPSDGRVTISAYKTAKNEIKIIVEDNGIGIPQAMIGKLFQIDSNCKRPGTDGESSSGLGLLLCKEFVDLQKGNIEVESETGIGATFIITFSLGRKNDEHHGWVV
jgi:PAS domain S-box-containing protein